MYRLSDAVNRKRAERLKAAPYHFRVVGHGQEFISKYYPSRDAARQEIRRLQAKGYRVSHFRNEYTGRALVLPESRRKT